jgi:hypothetical protein
MCSRTTKRVLRALMVMRGGDGAAVEEPWPEQAAMARTDPDRERSQVDLTAS